MKPIGQLIRERAGLKEIDEENQPAKLSLEEQIRMLEDQVEDEGIESDESSDEDEKDEQENLIPDDMTYERDDKGNIMRIVSKIYEERIEPLPKSQLPKAFCSKGSKQKSSFNLLKTLKPVETKVKFADQIVEKKKRPRSEKEEELFKERESKKERLSGLEATVLELLSNYKPSSSEKRPFW
eukprot:CAMPEP_0119039374 /NCGR_PEP_ID=MMETSP1177-20130426/8800_1 /TAXON_ID=2985 /ORGANISM="Ochromonas sp, Strain CCMP1899" /LENGTH=181 /DNA_ID=CAMNT_0007003127 /DNA_START=46 /DNA_END=588 /DNA_ORIENTATION=-